MNENCTLLRVIENPVVPVTVQTNTETVSRDEQVTASYSSKTLETESSVQNQRCHVVSPNFVDINNTKGTTAISRHEPCLESQSIKDVTSVNGYIKYNHVDNGVTTCHQNHVYHSTLDHQTDFSKDFLPDELTESSYSGSTVATEESMVSSICDDKICTENCTDNKSMEQVYSKLNSRLSDSLSQLHLDQCSNSASNDRDIRDGIEYVVYENEKQMPDIMTLITKDLSEPYSIYTYRYFIHNWPKLCFLSMDGSKCVGAIVCKLDMHKKMVRRGYIAMLAIDSHYRRRRIGSNLVLKAIEAMVADDCDEVVLETEITNKAALHLYENLGFVRDKRLFHYYLNGVDALRLKLWLR